MLSDTICSGVKLDDKKFLELMLVGDMDCIYVYVHRILYPAYHQNKSDCPDSCAQHDSDHEVKLMSLISLVCVSFVHGPAQS